MKCRLPTQALPWYSAQLQIPHSKLYLGWPRDSFRAPSVALCSIAMFMSDPNTSRRPTGPRFDPNTGQPLARFDPNTGQPLARFDESTGQPIAAVHARPIANPVQPLQAVRAARLVTMVASWPEKMSGAKEGRCSIVKMGV